MPSTGWMRLIVCCRRASAPIPRLCLFRASTTALFCRTRCDGLGSAPESSMWALCRWATRAISKCSTTASTILLPRRRFSTLLRRTRNALAPNGGRPGCLRPTSSTAMPSGRRYWKTFRRHPTTAISACSRTALASCVRALMTGALLARMALLTSVRRLFANRACAPATSLAALCRNRFLRSLRKAPLRASFRRCS